MDEQKTKEAIRIGIKEHLVVQNPKGIEFAVNKIYKLISAEKEKAKKE